EARAAPRGLLRTVPRHRRCVARSRRVRDHRRGGARRFGAVAAVAVAAAAAPASAAALIATWGAKHRNGVVELSPRRARARGPTRRLTYRIKRGPLANLRPTEL